MNSLVKLNTTKGQGKETTYGLYDWHFQMHRLNSHLYVKMEKPFTVNVSRPQLQKLHRNFFHPSTEKLFNLIGRAMPDEATTDTLHILENISALCDPFQRINTSTNRFRVSFGPEEIVFNERWFMYFIYINNSPILHVFDGSTHFSAARFLSKFSTKIIWETFLDCWSLIYTGLPNRILVDEGSSLSDQFISFGSLCNVDLSQTGFEAHSSLGISERYHQPLRTTFQKLRLAHPTISRETLLSMSVK